MNFVTGFLRAEDGVMLMEYGVLGMLVSGMAIVAISSTGQEVNRLFFVPLMNAFDVAFP